MRQRRLLGFVYLAIVLVCVTISGLTSYFGLLSSFGELALGATLVVTLLIFGADIAIKEFVQAGRSIIFPLIVFLFALSVSSVSHFNYFYTNFMSSGVARENYERAWAAFDDNMQKAENWITGHPSVAGEVQLRESIEFQLQNLLQQMLDPNNRGLGPRARDHMAQIDQLLGDVRLTQLAPPGSTREEDLRAWHANYSAGVMNALDQATSRAREDASTILRPIAEQLSAYRDLTSTIIGSTGGYDVIQMLQHIARMQEFTREVETTTNRMFPGPEGETLVLEAVPPEPGTGEIVYSLKSGFIDRPNFAYTLLAVFASLFIDCAPLVFAVMLFRKLDGPPDAPMKKDKSVFKN